MVTKSLGYTFTWLRISLCTKSPDFSMGHGYVLGDLLFNNTLYLILYSIKFITILLPCSYKITISDCLEDFGPFHYARLDYPLSLPIGGATATKGHDYNNREMLPMAIFILLDIHDLLKKVPTLEKCYYN